MDTILILLLGLAVGLGWGLYRRKQQNPTAQPEATEPLAHTNLAQEPPSVSVSAAAAVEASRKSATIPTIPNARELEVLGRGSSATVYRALYRPAANEPEREVAIKIFRSALDGQGQNVLGGSTQDRFMKEVQTLERLQHPNIVQALYSSQTANKVYVVMELLAGESLRTWCTPRSLLPENEILSIAKQLTDALAYAHEQGIIHRDLKPDNIVYDSVKHMAKLTDFGVAKWLQSTQTRSGMMLGSPAYMAPEQLMGQNSDARADIYALAVVLFELLVGQPPFAASSLGTLMHDIVDKPWPELPAQSPHQQAASWNTFLSQLSAKNPADRPRDARQVQQLLLDLFPSTETTTASHA